MFIRKVFPMLIILLGGVFLMSTQCSESSPQEGGFIERPLPAIRLDSLRTADDKWVCSLTVQTPDLCWKVARYNVEEKDGEIFVQVIGRREKDAMCGQMIGTLKVDVPLPVQKSGKYTLKLWSSEKSTIDTMVTLGEEKQ